MSARNYIVCPACRRQAAANVESAKRLALESYGKVPPEEFFRLTELAAKSEKQPLPQSLSEYYELGIGSNGRFLVVYNADCSRCGFEFKFSQDQTVELPAAIHQWNVTSHCKGKPD